MKTITHTMLRKVNLASFTTIFCISIICISLIVNSIFYICTYLLRFKAPMDWMSYRLDVLRACCLMFLHDFKNLNAVMLLSWLKDSKDSVIDYKTTNVMSFSAVLLSQSAFNFPNWLFHKCLIKNQANNNLSFVKRKMQGSGWRL